MGPGRRCARHALAAGPDGLCALCRSESSPPPRPYSTWVLGGLLLTILLVSVTAIAHRAVTGFAKAAGIEREPSASPPVTAAPMTTRVEAPVAPAAVPTAEVSEHVGDSVPLAEPLPAPVAPALAEAPATPPLASAPATLPAPTRPPPTQAELRAALNATPIVMYAASWCGVCRKARAFFAENGLRYQEIDADATPGSWEKIEHLTGRRAVPVIIVDGELTPSGLSPSNVMRAVSHSMERRLGVSGIRFTPT